ncbi:MAG: hypothetical protein RI932_1696 [Pseudomonadota bacterium]|jgi:hypothetical protein
MDVCAFLYAKKDPAHEAQRRYAAVGLLKYITHFVVYVTRGQKSVRIRMDKTLERSEGTDFEVEPQTPILDVPEVTFDSLFE